MIFEGLKSIATTYIRLSLYTVESHALYSENSNVARTYILLTRWKSLYGFLYITKRNEDKSWQLRQYGKYFDK